jgi:hypothetical protein
LLPYDSMSLPNYFLADLPPEAALNPGMISDACQALKRNRERYLQTRSTASLVRVLSELASDWLDPNDPFRKQALAADPRETGFLPGTLAAGLNAFFSQLTGGNLELLLAQELGDRRRLDDLCSTPA